MRLGPKHFSIYSIKDSQGFSKQHLYNSSKGKDRVVEVTKMVIDENLEREKSQMLG